MAFTEDLDAFLSTDDFAVQADFVPACGPPKLINVIFDDEYEAINAGTDVEVEGTAPMIKCKTKDVEGIKQGDDFTIESVAFKAVSHHPDGTGWSEVILRKV